LTGEAEAVGSWEEDPSK